MASPTDMRFTHEQVLRSERAVGFSCSDDTGAWPWLALGPRHPIVLLTALYWASVESSQALGAREEGKWSALTYARWECGEAACGALDHGIYENTSQGDRLSFDLAFFDADDALVTRFEGRGVVFRTRNFEGWRGESKPKERDAHRLEDFDFAPDAALGLGPRERAFLGPLATGGSPAAPGLITAENGMPPGNPFLSGSGDHVNATHLAEVGRQFVSLLRDGDAFEVASGEATFDRYVELGLPFEVVRAGGEGERTDMVVRQAGRDCSRITMAVR